MLAEVDPNVSLRVRINATHVNCPCVWIWKFRGIVLGEFQSIGRVQGGSARAAVVGDGALIAGLRGGGTVTRTVCRQGPIEVPTAVW
jgi:hypothetical protein